MAKEKNRNRDRKRELLALAVDVSETDTPDYIVMGYQIEDSSMDIEVESRKFKDINGVPHSIIDDMSVSQTFEPHVMTEGDPGKLGDKLVKGIMLEDTDFFQGYKCVVIYGWLGEEGSHTAVLHDNCTITPTGLGGGSWLTMPVDIALAGEKTLGTASGLRGKIEFTPGAEG